MFTSNTVCDQVWTYTKDAESQSNSTSVSDLANMMVVQNTIVSTEGGDI